MDSVIWIKILKDASKIFSLNMETFNIQWNPPHVCRLLWPYRTAAMKSRNSFSRREKDLNFEPSLPSKTVWYQSHDIHVTINIFTTFRPVPVYNYFEKVRLDFSCHFI